MWLLTKNLTALTFQKAINAGMCKGYGSDA